MESRPLARGVILFLLGLAVGMVLGQWALINQLDRERIIARMREARGDRFKSPARIIDEKVGEAIVESAAELHTSADPTDT